MQLLFTNVAFNKMTEDLNKARTPREAAGSMAWVPAKKWNTWMGIVTLYI
jgi:hypothetical protein